MKNKKVLTSLTCVKVNCWISPLSAYRHVQRRFPKCLDAQGSADGINCRHTKHVPSFVRCINRCSNRGEISLFRRCMVRDSYLGCTISSLPSKIGDGRRLHRITDMEEAGPVQVHMEGHFDGSNQTCSIHASLHIPFRKSLPHHRADTVQR